RALIGTGTWVPVPETVTTLALLRSRRRPSRPARGGAGAREAPGGLLVDRQHHRAVHGQALVRPLLEQVGEEALDQPFATRDDGSAQPDPNESLVELVYFFDPRPPREGRRAFGEDPLHRPDQILGAL